MNPIVLLVFTTEPLSLAFLSQDWDISRYFPFCCSDRKGGAFLFSLSPNIIHEKKTKQNIIHEASRALGEHVVVF